MVSNYWYEPKVVRIRDSGWKMQIYSLSSPIVIKNFFFTLKLFFLALIFRLLTYSKGQQSFEASKTIDSSNLSARSTKSNSFWSSWIRFYKSKAITFISWKKYIKNFFRILLTSTIFCEKRSMAGTPRSNNCWFNPKYWLIRCWCKLCDTFNLRNMSGHDEFKDISKKSFQKSK